MEMEKVIIIEEIYWIENHKISTRKIVRISRIFSETGPGSGPGSKFLSGSRTRTRTAKNGRNSGIRTRTRIVR